MKEIVKRWFGGADKIRLLIVLGVAGILLIGLSEWRDTPSKTEERALTVTALQIEEALEERVALLLSRIDGVGACHVMVTLEQSAQQVYAAESVSGGEKVLIVTTDSGPVGLSVTEIQPIIRGVVVVCDGGSEPAVCERVQTAVATAFNLSSRRVCVLY